MTVDSADASAGATTLPRGAKWACAAVAAVTFVVFLPSLSNGWVTWDDDTNFLNNPHYRGLRPHNLVWMFTTFLGGPYQPLSWLTLAVDYLVWGEQRPFGYHLTNVLMHSINAGLFAWVAARLFLCRANAKHTVPSAQCPVPSDAATAGVYSGLRTQHSGLAFGVMVGLFWGLHPLRVEAVSWITERREVLCGLLTLATLAWHLGGGGRAAVFCWAAAAMLAKGSAVVLPAMLVLVDLHRDSQAGRDGAARSLLRAVRRHAGVFALMFGISALAVWGQRDAKAMVSMSQAGLGPRADIFSNGLAFYALKTGWPAGLAPVYEVPRMLAALRRPAMVSRAAVVAAFVLACIAWRRVPQVLLLLTAYVLMVLPVGGLVLLGSQIAADRYSYQPGWALSLLAGALVWCGLGVVRSVAARSAAALAVGVACAALLVPPCQRMQRIWHDTMSLWDHQLAVYPETAIAHFNLAVQAIDAKTGRQGDAIAETHLRQAIAKLPRYCDAQRLLGDVLVHSGRVDEAIEHFHAALLSSPRDEPARIGLANALWNKGQRAEGIAELRQLVELSGSGAAERCGLARALAAAGEVKQAIGEYEAVLARWPDDVEALPQLSRLLSSHPLHRYRNGARAVELAERARRTSGPLTMLVAETLAAAYAETGAFDRAVGVLQEMAAQSEPEEVRIVDGLIRQYQLREPMRVEPKYP